MQTRTEWQRQQWWAQDPKALVTSGRVERRGGHDHVSIWVRGCKVGTLVMGAGFDGATLLARLGLLAPDLQVTP
jgi:hypothetical protein